MRMMKKFFVSALSVILAAFMSFGTFAAAADPTEGKCGPALTWSYDSSSGTLTISGDGPMYNYANFSDAVDCAPYSIYRSKIKYLVIEDGVTKIGTYAFSGLTGLVDVKFPESSVKEIGAFAFNYCINLPRMIIPDSVCTIGNDAFTTCQKMVMIRFGNGITELPSGVCRRASALTDVYIPESCKSLGNSAFYECKKLTSIDISGVENIEPNCFFSCISLKKVRLGDGIRNVGYNAFYSCEALSEIIFDGTPDMIASNFSYGSPWYNSHAAGLYTICDGTILMCKGIYSESELVVPDGVKIISQSAFANNQNITSVVLPEGLEVIGEMAFSRVDKLKSITIPESVREIGRQALGYTTEGTASSKADPAYVIIGKGRGTAYKYAAENGISYSCLHEYGYKTKTENCTEEIVRTKECLLCGIVCEKTYLEPMASHDFADAVTAPTCTQGGYTRSTCRLCGYSEIKDETSACGHTSSQKWILAVEPACEELGKFTVNCAVCAAVLEEKIIAKKGHTPAGKLRTVRAETCTQDGIYEKYCSDCGIILEAVTKHAPGHTLDTEWTQLISSVNGSAGYEVLLCTSCGNAVFTRWFILENGEKTEIENGVARQVYTQRYEAVISGEVSLSESLYLDCTNDGKVNAKDSLTVKQLTADNH